MTSWSLRRLREIAKSATISIRSATQATKGVGTREQLVRVPIQHGTMTAGRSDDCRSLRSQQRWHPLCHAGDEGVGTREQLVRVPIQHGYGSPSMIVKSLISCES